MTILFRNSFQQYFTGLISLMLFSGQLSSAQTYLNFNFTDNTNKYSLLTDVSSITFNGSGGIIVKRTDNSISTETMNLLRNLTMDATNGGGAPLPVELVSFTAVSTSGNTTLKWTTATERNNYGFEIQRSVIGDQMSDIRAWMKTGFVEGNGTINTGKEYSFTDNTVRTGRYSYRLKQIDRDGTFAFSKETEVTAAGAPMKFQLEQNYPNPFNPSTTIGFSLHTSGYTTLTVYDVIGREVATLVHEVLIAGVHHERLFDASKLGSGIYFTRLNSNGQSQIRKMALTK